MTVESLNLEEKDLIRHDLNTLKDEIVKSSQEKINTPGEFNFIKKYKDKQNRNRKIYSYTLKYGGNDKGIENKYYNKFGQHESLLPNRNFCDNNGNIIETDGNFDKGETVYIRVPDRDIIDNIPEITMDEIEKLSDNEIKKIYNNYLGFIDSDSGFRRYEHADKNGDYIMINGKKLYVQYLYGDHRIFKSQKPCILYENHEDGRSRIRIGRYNGENFHGIEYYDSGKVKRGTIELDDLDDTRLR